MFSFSDEFFENNSCNVYIYFKKMMTIVHIILLVRFCNVYHITIFSQLGVNGEIKVRMYV